MAQTEKDNIFESFTDSVITEFDQLKNEIITLLSETLVELS
jgi:hypothetical protein